MKKAEYNLYNHLFPYITNSLSFGESCSLCQLDYNFIGKDIIWGNGLHSSKIMVIGKDSAGGDNKEILWKGSRFTKIPLSNKKSGAKIRIMLHKVGINPHQVFFTNTLKCNIGYQDEYNISYKNLAKFCVQHLIAEIKIIKPKMIICLGRSSHQMVCRIIEKYNTGLELEQCKYLEHPSRVEGIDRESKYLNKLRQLVEENH